MTMGKRLGQDPLARPGTPGREGRQALRHILGLAPPAPEAEPGRDAGQGEEKVAGPESGAVSEPGCAPDIPHDAVSLPQPDREAVYKEVAGKFAEAMDSLSRMSAREGGWGWCPNAGEGDPLPSMRLMAAYVVSPEGEGVDLEAYLNDVGDHWRGGELALSLHLRGRLMHLPRAFTLARALQAAMDGFCRPGKHGAALLNLDASFNRRGAIVFKLHGCRELFPGRDPALQASEAEPLLELARRGEVSLRFTSTDETAELAVTIEPHM